MPPTLEARVASLEHKVDKLIDDSRDIKTTLVTLRDYLNEIRGKISQLPTWWQALLGIVAVAGLVFAVARAMK
jgi:predicted double-glycine peptidase